MKIVFLEMVQDFGGARISTVELAARLSTDHEVLILDTYGSCKPFVNTVNDKKINLSIAMPRQAPFIINGSANKLHNLVNLVKFFPHWIILRSKVQKIISEFDADQVIINNSKVLSLLFLFRNKNFKTILFARGWFLPKQINLKDYFLYKLLVDKYVCVAEATRQAIYAGKLAALENIYVVHNAINPDELPQAVAEIDNSDGSLKILHSGGFLPDKGIHISIEVAKVLKSKGVKFKLIITGLIYKGAASSNYYKHILNLIKVYALDDQVLIVENNPNVIPYFRACDILIHPSSTEGLPRVIMESMVLKKPVIANAVGGVTDYILHKFTGLITNFNSVDEYVNYIELLAKDKELYNFLTDNAFKLIKNSFNEDMQKDSFNNIFKTK